MRPPETVMKQRILVCLMAALLLVLGLLGSAMAEGADSAPVVNATVNPDRFYSPGPTQVTVTIQNTADVEKYVALYGPTGHRITDFPTMLPAGTSHTWTGTWQVTEEHLNAGRLLFMVSYQHTTAQGEQTKKTMQLYIPIVQAGLEAQLEVSRSITPTTALNNQKVYVTYTIANVGPVDVTDLTIKESSAISSSDAKLGSLAAGETATHTFTVTMKKKSLASHATVSYTAGGETKSITVDEATIQYVKTGLKATLSADKKGGPVGDVVKLTLKLENTTGKEIGNITVTDPVLGTVFSGETVAAGATLTLEKELTITSTTDHLFTITGTNASGDTISSASEQLRVIAVDPALAANLSLVAEADSTAIYTRPGIVKFTVHVTNNGAVDATNVKVVSSGVTVYPYNTSSGGVTLAPGQTLSFVRDVLVETPGTFRFDATAAGQLGETVTFNGNELRIFYAPPTATPSMVPVAAPVKPTDQPLPTSDTLPESYDKAEELLNIGFWAALALAGVSLALILVGIVGRAAANAKAANAAENIQRVHSNDYGKSVPKRKRRYLPESESTVAVSNDPAEAFEPIEAPAEFTEAAPEELAAAMEETMTELYPEAVMEADAPAAPAYEPYEGEFTAAPEYAAEPSADDLSASVAAAPVEEPTYRRRRRSDK